MEATLRRFLGKTARAARLQLGLTQAQVAERVELAVAVYGRIERGHLTPSLPTVLRLCGVLELDANALLGFSAPTPPPWFAPLRPSQERPTVHEFLRTARKLRRRQLTALAAVAHAMRATGAPLDARQEAPHAELEK